MSNLPVDRDKDYMYQMWGTTSLASDYTSLEKKSKVIQEIMHDEVPKNRHHLKEQTQLHQNIRNDSDYDDWEYGTDANYGFSWK